MVLASPSGAPGRLIAGVVLLLAAARLSAQGQPDSLALEAEWQTERYLGDRSPLVLRLSRPVRSTAERLAMLVGTADVTSLLEVSATRARYRPSAVRLPAGESEVVAYLIAIDGSWREIGRFPLKVRRLGLDRAQVIPHADVSSAGQLAQRVPDGDPPPDRRTYQDLTLRLGLESTLGRDGWQATTQANAVAVTREDQRLRWGELGTGAPAMDLADYRMQLTAGPTRLSVGGQTVGNHRQLVSGFSSRGAGAGFQISRAAGLTAVVVSGTSVVGWSNLLGLARPEHRLATATLELELMPARPGGFHLDLTALDGSVLAAAGFNQAAVTDAEESRGLGAQMALSDVNQRVRLTAGVARSRYRNPNDPLLRRDTTIVMVRPVTRTARYGELSLELFRAAPLSKTTQLSLTVTARHERVDPLYRTLGAPLQSDVERNGGELSAAVGALSLQGGIGEARDNLASLPSILTTRTRNSNLGAGVPLAALLGVPSRWFWPSLTLGWQRVRQRGEGVPDNGDFSATHVPDQISTEQSAQAAWASTAWSLGYRWNQSFQDNRQTGRELADFRATVHALSVGFSPAQSLRANVDLSVERQKNIETATTQRVERLGAAVQWQVRGQTAVAASASRSWGYDAFADQRTRNLEYQIELSQGFRLYRLADGGTQGRTFLRLAGTRAAILPAAPAPTSRRIAWTLNAGGSFRLY